MTETTETVETAWTHHEDGRWTFQLAHLELVAEIRVGSAETRHWWEVNDTLTGHTINGDHCPPDNDSPKAARGYAFAAAERWIAGVGRFDAGAEIQVELGWLANLYEARENLDKAGADPRTLITITRQPGEELPLGAQWSCPCDVADLEWQPSSDADAAALFDAWAKHEAFMAAAAASAETKEEQAERVGGALDACREMAGEPAPEIEPLEVPDRTPDEARPQELLALIELSPAQKMTIADAVMAKRRAIKTERLSAKEAATIAREKIGKLEEEMDELATRYERGGEMEPRPHRVELYFAEGIAAVRREDTSEIVDVRELLAHERQGELQLDGPSDEEEKLEAAPDGPPPYEVASGCVLVSRDSGRRVRVMSMTNGASHEDGRARAMIHKLTKAGQLDKRAQATESTLAQIYVGYRPIEPPTPPAEAGEAAPPPA